MPEPTYPADWKLDEFPRPNPYFPPVPRTGRSGLPLPLIGKVLMAVGLLSFVGGLAARALTDKPAVLGALVLGGLLTVVIGFVVFRAKAGSGVWNEGRIVPAMVWREGSGGGLDYATNRMLFGRVGAGMMAAMTLQYVSGGAVKHASLAGPGYTVGSVVWIALYQGAHALPGVAPPPFDAEVPPQDVVAWLKDALDAAQGRAPLNAPRQDPPDKAPWE